LVRLDVRDAAPGEGEKSDFLEKSDFWDGRLLDRRLFLGNILKIIAISETFEVFKTSKLQKSTILRLAVQGRWLKSD
jgi:hypothetical protein